MKIGVYSVLGYAGKIKGDHRWYCRCECGAIESVSTRLLPITKTAKNKPNPRAKTKCPHRSEKECI